MYRKVSTKFAKRGYCSIFQKNCPLHRDMLGVILYVKNIGHEEAATSL